MLKRVCSDRRSIAALSNVSRARGWRSWKRLTRCLSANIRRIEPRSRCLFVLVPVRDVRSSLFFAQCAFGCAALSDCHEFALHAFRYFRRCRCRCAFLLLVAGSALSTSPVSSSVSTPAISPASPVQWRLSFAQDNPLAQPQQQ